MKIFVIFVLFSIAENLTLANWMSSRRTKWERNVNDILDITEKTSSFEDFHELLRENIHNEHSFSAIHHGDLEYSVRQVHKLFVLFDFTFMHVSFVYFAQFMMEYYIITGRYPSDLIGSNGGRGFSMFTAWFDRDITDDQLEKTLCSLFLLPNKRTTHSNFMWQLSMYKNIYKETMKLPANSGRRPSLTKVEEVILNFSDAFSSRWRPLAGNFLHSAHPKLDRQKQFKSIFIRHVFEKETCVVHPELNGYTTWQCDGILNSREYGLEKYEGDVIKTTRLEHLHEKPQIPNTEKREIRQIEFSLSLVELENKIIEDYSDYRNVVRYYNIVNDVILLVSIREGRKILKVVNHMVTRRCREDNVIVNEILELRATLSTFKSVFDRLVAVMLDEKRIYVRYNSHRTAFDRQVDSLVKLLYVRDKWTDNGMSILEMCTEVPNVLKVENYEVDLGSNAYNNVKFHQFYFTLPILYINQLYRFYAYDFM